MASAMFFACALLLPYAPFQSQKVIGRFTKYFERIC